MRVRLSMEKSSVVTPSFKLRIFPFCMDSRDSLNSYPKKKKVGKILTVDNLIWGGISILSYTGAVFAQVVVNLWIIC